jgi:hypothetical protein
MQIITYQREAPPVVCTHSPWLGAIYLQNRHGGTLILSLDLSIEQFAQAAQITHNGHPAEFQRSLYRQTTL